MADSEARSSQQKFGEGRAEQTEALHPGELEIHSCPSLECTQFPSFELLVRECPSFCSSPDTNFLSDLGKYLSNL